MTVKTIGIVLILAAGASGCGSVERKNDTPEALKLLHLYPHDGENGVPRGVKPLLVFSHRVFADAGCLPPANMGANIVLYNQECGVAANVVEASLDCYRQRDSQGNEAGKDPTIVVLSPAAQLASASRYCLAVTGALAGFTRDGAATGPLGADISASFTTGQ